VAEREQRHDSAPGQTKGYRRRSLEIAATDKTDFCEKNSKIARPIHPAVSD
jgi:hypothetical protein